MGNDVLVKLVHLLVFIVYDLMLKRSYVQWFYSVSLAGVGFTAVL